VVLINKKTSLFHCFIKKKLIFYRYKTITNFFFAYVWTDLWLGGVPCYVKLNRLFDLSENKLSTVAYMCGLGWQEGGAAWQWRRQYWALEVEFLRECRSVLYDISL